MASQNITIQSEFGTKYPSCKDTYIFLAVPALSSVVLTSNKSNPIQPVGSGISLTCTVELSPSVVESDLSVLMVDAQLSRDGTPLNLTGPTVTGTTFTYTIQLDSFGRSDSGNYECTATVRPQPPSTYIIGNEVAKSNVTSVTTGKFSVFIIDCMMVVHRCQDTLTLIM